MGGVDGVISDVFLLGCALTAFFIIIGLFMPQLDQFLTGIILPIRGASTFGSAATCL